MTTKTASPKKETRISENSKEAHRANLLSQALGKKVTPVGDVTTLAEQDRVKELIKKIRTEDATTIQPGIKGVDLKRINKEAKAKEVKEVKEVTPTPTPEVPVDPLAALLAANPGALALLANLIANNTKAKEEPKVKEVKEVKVKEPTFTRIKAIATIIKTGKYTTKEEILPLADELYNKETGTASNINQTSSYLTLTINILKENGYWPIK